MTSVFTAAVVKGCPYRQGADREFAAVYRPMIDAFEAGAFAHCLMDRNLIVLAAPKIWMRDGRLKRSDGPVWELRRTTVWEKDLRG